MIRRHLFCIALAATILLAAFLVQPAQADKTKKILKKLIIGGLALKALKPKIIPLPLPLPLPLPIPLIIKKDHHVAHSSVWHDDGWHGGYGDHGGWDHGGGGWW